MASGITVVDALQGTDEVLPKVFKNSLYESYDVELLKKEYYAGTKSLLYTFICRGNGKIHKETIYFISGVIEKGGDHFPSIYSRAQFFCDCEAFQFYFAYALYVAKAYYGGVGKYTSTPAYEKNPKSIPGVCKHLVQCIRAMFDSGELFSELGEEATFSEVFGGGF